MADDDYGYLDHGDDPRYEIECYGNCSHLGAAIVPRFNRYPLNRFDRSSTAVDGTVQISSGSNFTRRDGTNLGSVRPESDRSKFLRKNDQTRFLNKDGFLFQKQFKSESSTRMEQLRTQNCPEKNRSMIHTV